MKDWLIVSPAAVVCVGAMPPPEFGQDVSVSGGFDAGVGADVDTSAVGADVKAQTGADADKEVAPRVS